MAAHLLPVIQRVRLGLILCLALVVVHNFYSFGFMLMYFFKIILYSREEVGCSSEARSYGKLLWMNSYQLACLQQSRLYFYHNDDLRYLLKFSEIVTNK